MQDKDPIDSMFDSYKELASRWLNETYNDLEIERTYKEVRPKDIGDQLVTKMLQTPPYDNLQTSPDVRKIMWTILMIMFNDRLINLQESRKDRDNVQPGSSSGPQ